MNNFTERQIEIMEAAISRIDRFGIQNLTTKNLALDIGLSEPALYRHFKSKNDILLGLLNFFLLEMKTRISEIINQTDMQSGDELRAIFNSQLKVFTEKPSIVSVIFAESIFHFDKALSNKVSEIMNLMQIYVLKNIEKGQKVGHYNRLLNSSTLTTIIIGSMRMTVLKWKLCGHKTNLIKNGKNVIEGILKMIEKNK